MATSVDRLVPMLHVVDVEASIRFYELLGFTVANKISPHGRTTWAWLESGLAFLMLAAASGPVDSTQQAILLYLYCNDVRALRSELLAKGLHDGGQYRGQPEPMLPNNGRSVVFEPTAPAYMPKGEIRVADPDGYCLLIGQPG